MLITKLIVHLFVYICLFTAHCLRYVLTQSVQAFEQCWVSARLAN